MLQVIATYSAIPGRLVDTAMLRAWVSFDLEEFADKIVRRRGSLLGCDVSNLDAEEVECLCALVDFENANSGALVERFNNFRKSRKLDLHEFMDHDDYGITGLLSRFISTRSPGRTVDINRLARLKSLRALRLPQIAPESIPLISTLTLLEQLSFRLGQPAKLEPLEKLGKLEVLQLEGPGIEDVKFLERCNRLNSLIIGRPANLELTGFHFPATLLEISLFRMKRTKMFDALWDAGEVNDLVIIDADIHDFRLFACLKRLQKLSIMDVAGDGIIPFSELLELRELAMIDVSVDAVAALDRAVSVTKLRVGSWGGSMDKREVEFRPPNTVEELRLESFSTPKWRLNCGGLLNLKVLHTRAYVAGIESALKSPALKVVRWQKGMSDDIREELSSRGIEIQRTNDGGLG